MGNISLKNETVFTEFDVEGGILGLGRDLVHSVLTGIGSVKAFRNLVGCSQETYQCSKHHRFALTTKLVLFNNFEVMKVFRNSDLIQMEKDFSRFSIDFSCIGEKMDRSGCLMYPVFPALFFETPLFAKKWRLKLSIVNVKGCAFGVSEQVNFLRDDDVRFTPRTLVYSYSGCMNQGRVDNGDALARNSELKNGDYVCMEVDMDNRRVVFFVNDKKQRYSYSGIPSKVYIVVFLGKVGAGLTFLSLTSHTRSMLDAPAPTPAPASTSAPASAPSLPPSTPSTPNPHVVLSWGRLF